MSLIGSTNEEKIWNYLKAKGLPDCGIAGLMGNLYAESCLIPTNLQNSYEKALSFTDAAYTAAVDNGTYQNFVKDSAGYGLAQWTYWSRKKNLLDFAKKKAKYFTGRKGTSSYALTTQVLNESEWTPEVVEQRQKNLMEVFKKGWGL